MPKYSMHVTVETKYEFIVEAPTREGAFDKARDQWIKAPTVGQWELPDEETSYDLVQVDV